MYYVILDEIAFFYILAFLGLVLKSFLKFVHSYIIAPLLYTSLLRGKKNLHFNLRVVAWRRVLLIFHRPTPANAGLCWELKLYLGSLGGNWVSTRHILTLVGPAVRRRELSYLRVDAGSQAVVSGWNLCATKNIQSVNKEGKTLSRKWKGDSSDSSFAPSLTNATGTWPALSLSSLIFYCNTDTPRKQP